MWIRIGAGPSGFWDGGVVLVGEDRGQDSRGHGVRAAGADRTVNLSQDDEKTMSFHDDPMRQPFAMFPNWAKDMPGM